jgi:hypothetical protein
MLLGPSELQSSNCIMLLSIIPQPFVGNIFCVLCSMIGMVRRSDTPISPSDADGHQVPN